MASKNGYEFHPVAEIFPMMEGAAYAELVADIKEHGLRDSILLAEGKIADGRNRYQACIEAEVAPRFEQWDKKGSLVALVLSRNAHRRHLDRSQLAMVAAKALPFFEGEAEKRQKTGTLASKESKGKATEKAAESVGASPASVARAKTVIEKGSPELVAAVESGEVKVTDAAAIVDQPKAKQRKAVNAVKSGKAKTVKAAVKEIEAETKPEEQESVAVDGWGVPIQDHAKEAFAAVEKFDELLSLLRKADRLYSEIAELPGGAYLQRPGVSINSRERWKHAGIKDAILAVQDSKPTYTVCPYEYHARAIPESKHKHDKNCVLCKGMNWSRPLGKEEISEKVVATIKEAFGV